MHTLDKRLILSVLLIILIFRFILFYYFPGTSGDEEAYFNFAKNIAEGCGFSMLKLDSDQCGALNYGVYFPGYPFFISLFTYLFSDDSDIKFCIIFSTNLIFCISLKFLYEKLLLVSKSEKACLFFILLIGLNPLVIGYSRYILTENLVNSLLIFILSNFINFDVHSRKQRYITILYIVAATYIRPDSILILLLFILPIFKLNNLKKIIIINLEILLITSILISPWLVREYLGSGQILSMTRTSDKPFEGYRKWVKSWAVIEYEWAAATYPSSIRDFKFPEENFFISKQEIENAKKLIDNSENNKFSKETDIDFNELADAINSKKGILEKFSFFSIKSILIILSPTSTHGLPLSLDITNEERIIILSKILNFNIKEIFGNIYIYNFVARILIMIYKIILIIFTFLLILKYYNIILNNNFEIFNFIFLFSMRLIFLSHLDWIEHRYMSPYFILLETAIFINFYRKESNLRLRNN